MSAHCVLDEKCGCGAEFHWMGDRALDAHQAATRWREQHQHAPATEPGLCWSDSGFDGPSGSGFRCELQAGHDGAHECDRGMWGGRATWANDEARQRTTDRSRPGLGTAGVTGAQPDEPASQAGRPASGGAA